MPRPTPFSRRSALALPPTLLLAFTAGCDDTSSGQQEAAKRDPDEGLLASVVTATQELRRTIAAAADGTGASAALAALGGCLDAHLAVLAPDLEAEDEAESEASGVPPETGTDTDVPAQGRTHLTLLTDAAGRAESGAFARVLASAAAGLAQHLAPLERARTKDSA